MGIMEWVKKPSQGIITKLGLGKEKAGPSLENGALMAGEPAPEPGSCFEMMGAMSILFLAPLAT